MKKHYMLTGATGVVGSALLKLLVNRGERVTLLIRASSEDHLKQRVESLMSFCELHGDHYRQVTALMADLHTPQFGLSSDVYQELGSAITHVLHCAGNVTMSLPLDVARSQTMAMTRNVVSFMEEGTAVKKMEYVSTVGVAGHTSDEIREVWLNHEREFRNSYEAAKSEAEVFIQQKVKEGMDITVHRPSMVVGDGKTGKNISFQVFYYLCEFLSGAGTFGCVPDLKGTRLDIIPSDYVAEVLYWSSCQEEGVPRVLHLCSGPEGSLDLNILADRVRNVYTSFGRTLPLRKRIPVSVYTFFITVIKRFVSEKARKGLNTLPVFLAYLKVPQHFANTETRTITGKAGIELPDAETYLEPVLHYYLQKKKNVALSRSV